MNNTWIVLCMLIGFCESSHTKAKSLQADFEVVVDLSSTVGDMNRIWDNTGLSPPGPGEDAVEYLSSKDLLLNLALIGSLPFKAITHVRIHWLLDLISLRYDYYLLDELVDWLRAHRMRPGFELMGNPGQVFTDLDSNPVKIKMWEDFIDDLAAHYINKFGIEEIKKWRFELWNEPDSKQYNILNLTTIGYINYATASMKGLAKHGLSLAGPAGTFKDFEHHNISWGLLEWCNSMIEISGQCALDTITFHKKGGGSALQVVASTSEFYSTATNLFPHLKNKSFANNEADILTGWWRTEEWRGDVNYAAQVCEVIMLFLAEIKMNKLPLTYISNDNGFMNDKEGFFNQRTLLTRFEMKSSTVSQFVRKPVMVAMAMLSYLGSKEMPVFRRRHEFSSQSDARLSVLAAGDGAGVGPGWSAAVIIALTSSSVNCSNKHVHIRFRLPSDIELTSVVYQLDNVLTNPRSIWEKSGKPRFPDRKLLRQMRENEGPFRSWTESFAGEWEEMNLMLRCPSVTLIHFCSKRQTPPAKILNLHAVNITFNDVLLLWQDSDTRCVKTFEVHFCDGDCPTDDYRLVTNQTIIMLAYQFSPTSGASGVEATRGRYKVRAVDYWNQAGTFSDVLSY